MSWYAVTVASGLDEVPLVSYLETQIQYLSDDENSRGQSRMVLT